MANHDAVALIDSSQTASGLARFVSIAGFAPSNKGTVPPVIGSSSPSTGTPIGAKQAITVPVTDDHGLARVTLSATFPSGLCELIYDGTFRSGYSAGSSTTPLTNPVGISLTVARTAGWPESQVTIKVDAVDDEGNVATPASYTYAVTPTSSTPPSTPSPSGGGIGFQVD